MKAYVYVAETAWNDYRSTVHGIFSTFERAKSIFPLNLKWTEVAIEGGGKAWITDYTDEHDQYSIGEIELDSILAKVDIL